MKNRHEISAERVQKAFEVVQDGLPKIAKRIPASKTTLGGRLATYNAYAQMWPAVDRATPLIKQVWLAIAEATHVCDTLGMACCMGSSSIDEDGMMVSAESVSFMPFDFLGCTVSPEQQMVMAVVAEKNGLDEGFCELCTDTFCEFSRLMRLYGIDNDPTKLWLDEPTVKFEKAIPDESQMRVLMEGKKSLHEACEDCLQTILQDCQAINAVAQRLFRCFEEVEKVTV